MIDSNICMDTQNTIQISLTHQDDFPIDQRHILFC